MSWPGYFGHLAFLFVWNGPALLSGARLVPFLKYRKQEKCSRTTLCLEALLLSVLQYRKELEEGAYSLVPCSYYSRWERGLQPCTQKKKSRYIKTAGWQSRAISLKQQKSFRTNLSESSSALSTTLKRERSCGRGLTTPSFHSLIIAGKHKACNLVRRKNASLHHLH